MNKNLQNGFSLIEVLMALVIFSVAILGLMHAGTQNIRATHSIENKQIAGIVADNQLILALSGSKALRKGRQNDVSKMAGRDWHWDIITNATAQPNFYKLTITVRQNNNPHVLITRTAFASVPQKAAP